MSSNSLIELAKYQRKLAALQKAVAKQQSALLALPSKFGFKSVKELIKALRDAAKSGGKSPKGAAKSAGTRKRAVITAETKAKVKSLVGAGKTGAEIAKTLGISIPSVANIKRELGLVKKRD